jgi:sugar/nucleoside kinase (ribokinase family)
MEAAIDHASSSGTKVAFTLSDGFVVERHRADFLRLIDSDKIDILFANELEFLHLAHETDLEARIGEVRGPIPTLVVTRSEKGALGFAGGARAGARRADRAAGRHDRGRRPVRRRLPCRTGARQIA